MVRNEQWAELSQEQGKLELEVYPCRDGKAWVLNYDDVVAALSEARHRLISDRPPTVN